MIQRFRLDKLTLLAGLVPRLALAISAIPQTHTQWFLPFLMAAPRQGFDPWTGFLASGGQSAAFPYGFLFLAAFEPATWIGSLVGGSYGAHVGLALAILFWEFVLLAAIVGVGSNSRGAAAARVYWLSPVPIYVGYWHGQLDVFPAALLVLGFLALRHAKWEKSGALLGGAVAAKLSMAIALPFVGLYLLGRNRLHPYALRVSLFALSAISVFLFPFALSPGFRTMVLGTPETQKIFSATLQITPELTAYLLPLVLLALFYWAWRIRRLDFEMTWTFSALAVLALFLLTTASPGWVMWLMPFIALHVARGGFMHRIAFWVFTIAYVGLNLLQSTGAIFTFGPDLTLPFVELIPHLRSRAMPILETILLAAGIALAVQMSFSGIVLWPFNTASRKPFAIGIAGDSGTGKDTLVDALQDMFGSTATSRLSGDDYHLWDRQNPMWRAVTHLHPKANDLETFGRHVVTLADGHHVFARHYDHGSGRAGRETHIPAREIVLASGLHALWSPQLIARYDVSVFMDMDEDLRRFVKLWRDVTVRGYPPQKVVDSIARRSADRRRFIQPQARNAGIVFRLEPRHSSTIDDPQRPLNSSLLRLVVTLDRGMSFDEPARLLIALCGIYVVETPLEDGRTEVLIDGELTSDSVAAVARRLVPGMMDFLAVEPKWHPDMTGIMQLVILYELDNARRKRASAA